MDSVISISAIEIYVNNILEHDKTGHDMSHINNVRRLALQFTDYVHEPVNKEKIEILALLHDVDDYKVTNTNNLEHANYILRTLKYPNSAQIIEDLSNFGYHNRLLNKQPSTIEGILVSDADMCDAVGATGIVRTHQYSILKHIPFFNRVIWPRQNLSYEQYMTKPAASSVCHMFEKLFKLGKYTLTPVGTKECMSRIKTMIDFLYQFFVELDAGNWINFLYNFIYEIYPEDLWLLPQ